MDWIVTPQDDSEDSDQSLKGMCPGWLSFIAGLIYYCDAKDRLCNNLTLFELN